MTVEYQKVWRTMNDLEMVTSKICSAREIIDNAVDKIQEHQNDKAELLMTAAYEFLEYYLQEFDDKFKLAWQATVGDLRDGDREAYSAVMKEKEYYEPSMFPLDHSNFPNDFWNDADKDNSSSERKSTWNDFWESYYPEENAQYTEEELNAMCNAAEKKHSKHYYDYTRNDLNRPNPFDKREDKTLNYDEAISAGWTMTDDGIWMPPQKQNVQTRWILPVQEAKDADTDETEYFVSFPQDLLDAADLKEGDAIHWIDNNDGSYTIRKPTKPLGMDEC